ncbi:hypothetical protein ABPG77_007161 [Micractinium sp. CCAP 211/92]
MLAVMHSLDERLVYGAFRVTAWGRRLDPSFPLLEFQHHIRVQPLRLFQLWAMLQFYFNKLHTKLDMRHRFGRAFGEGWQKLLEAAQSGEASGTATGDRQGVRGRQVHTSG